MIHSNKTMDLSCKSFGGRPSPHIKWFKMLNHRVTPLTGLYDILIHSM